MSVYSKRVWLLLLSVGGAWAIGCGEQAEQPEIILRVSNWGGAQVESDFMRLERQFTREFEAQHPGVSVRVEQIPGYGQYAPKLLMMHVTGSVPDVIHLDASSAAVFIDNGVVGDLTPYIEKDQAAGKFSLDDYFENVVNIDRRGDELYAIPLDFTPMVVYYNKRLFDAANVPYPQPGWTWDDFLDKAQKLTIFPEGARSPTQYGFFFENWMPFWVLWFWTNGADVLSPDGTRAGGYLDSPKSIEAMQFLVDLMTKHRVTPQLKESSAAGGGHVSGRDGGDGLEGALDDALLPRRRPWISAWWSCRPTASNR